MKQQAEKEMARRLGKSVQKLTAMNEMAQAIVSTVDLSEILDRVLALLRPLLGAEATLIFLQDKEELVVSAVNREGVANLMGRRIPVNAGIAGDVWQSGQSLLLRGEACRRALAPQLLGSMDSTPQAILVVPIRWQARLLGVLEAIASDPAAFIEDDLRLLETAAAWTAIAIANAGQHQRLQRRLHESEAIAAISRALTGTLELGQVLEMITQIACDVIPNVDWAVIHLRQDQSQRLQLAASTGLELGDRIYDLEPGQGIIGEVMGQGNIVNVPDMQADPRRLPIEEELNARCLLIAPIQGREQRLGTLTIQCAIPAAFTADDEQMLGLLGTQAGIAIENARLYESEQQARRSAERRREGMRRLARQVVIAQEDERQHIARELHDETGQALTSFKISLELIRAGLPPEMESIRNDLAALIELADKTMGNLRLLAHNLRPPGLDAFGLNISLAGLCQDFAGFTNIQVQYQGMEVESQALPLLTSLSLYRFVQEALTNAAKHAQATRIEVVLQQDAENILLSVTDNGRGFEPPPDLDSAEDLQGVGLRGMYERLIMINGRLEIHTSPGRGTRLLARVPLVEGV
jgi:signal transduction histidine kinase